MTKVIGDMAVSVDGFITGRDPGPEAGLGDAAEELHGWYWNGPLQSTVFPGFHLTEPSLRFIDPLVARGGAVIAGRTTYDDSRGWGGGSPHPTAPLIVLSSRPAPRDASPQQRFASTVQDALAEARSAAGELDVVVMGGGAISSMLAAGLLDEMVVHEVPVLLGSGRRLFGELPAHIALEVIDVVRAPDVTHRHYRVTR